MFIRGRVISNNIFITHSYAVLNILSQILLCLSTVMCTGGCEKHNIRSLTSQRKHNVQSAVAQIAAWIRDPVLFQTKLNIISGPGLG